VGVGNYTLSLKKELYPNENSYFYQPVHNIFMLILSEIGIFGFLSFLAFIFYFIYLIFKNNIYYLSLISALIIMFSFDHYYWTLHFGILLMFFLFGILLKEGNVSENI
jgi:O-antigen ligase